MTTTLADLEARVAAAREEGAAEEREACAKECESSWIDTGATYARRIRARGTRPAEGTCGLRDMLAERDAEVALLRAEVASRATALSPADLDAERLRAEVERLRAEVERLRAELATATDDCADYRMAARAEADERRRRGEEVERLRADLRASRDAASIAAREADEARDDLTRAREEGAAEEREAIASRVVALRRLINNREQCLAFDNVLVVGELMTKKDAPVTPERRAELRALAERAWQPPWVARTFEIDCPCPNGSHCGDSHTCEEVEATEEYPNGAPGEPAAEGDGQCVVQISVPGLDTFSKPTAALIAAMRNGLEPLLTALDAAEAEVAALRRQRDVAREVLVRICQSSTPQAIVASAALAAMRGET